MLARCIAVVLFVLFVVAPFVVSVFNEVAETLSKALGN